MRQTISDLNAYMQYENVGWKDSDIGCQGSHVMEKTCLIFPLIAMLILRTHARNY